MAVKTGFSEDNFIRILSEYDLGEFQDFKPITKGAVQTNFLLETTRGRFVFRYYENRSLGSVLFESELIEYLNDNNYPCPGIFRNRTGEYVGLYNEKPYIIFEFVEGEHLENPSDHQKRQLIEKVAGLHNLTKDYVPPHKEDRWNYSVELCRELARGVAEKMNTRNSIEKLEWFERELSNIDLPDSLPKGVCHCDFHFSNILFKDGEFRALLDFDDANYTYLTYDLAALIDPFVSSFDWDSWSNFKTNENIFDFTEARRVVAEYMKYRGLNEEEEEHLFDVYKLTIMLDCIWYFSRGNASNFYERRKMGHLNRLGREEFRDACFA